MADFTRDATSAVINDPNALVLQAVEQSVWGSSLRCTVRQRTFLYDSEYLGVGRYYHAGQGTGQFRLDMQFADGDNISNMLQVSDGRLMWTISRASEPLRKVHLDRLRQFFAHLGRRSNRPDVSLYLAIGGQPESLRFLYHRYRWYKIYAGNIQDVPVWQLIGTLRTQLPNPATAAQVDMAAFKQETEEYTPTDVRLTLIREGNLPLFPIQIEYFRRKDETSSKQGKESGGLIPYSIIEYFDVVSPIEMTAELFQHHVPEDAERIEDETGLYLPPAALTKAREKTLR